MNAFRTIKGTWIILCPLLFFIVSVDAYAASLEVGDGKRFATIGAALGAVSEGDTVEVYGGSYVENIRVEKKIILRGIDHPVIDGSASGHVVVVAAPGVVFEGFRVVNGGNNLADDDSGIFIEGSATGTSINNNIVERCAFGIWANGTHDVRISRNHVVGRRELISQKRGNGIHLWNVRNGLVEENRIEGARDGILVSITRKTLIKNNRIWDLRYGIHYMYADFNRVEGNVTFNNKGGIAIMFSKKLEIENNYSHDNDEFGIMFRDLFRSKVTGNILTGNEKGLFLYNSLYNEIRENIIAENEIGSHVWAGSEDNMVSHNTFIDNRAQVKYIGMEDEEWSHEGEGNYWSDYVGWDADSDGKGDTPYEPNSIMERLLWSYPVLKLLLNSPAVQTLRMVENQFPVIRSAGITDSAPLMRPVNDKWRDWVGRDGD